MPDHPLFIGIGDRAAFKARHGRVGVLQVRLHPSRKFGRKRQPRKVERYAQTGVVVQVFLETVPVHLNR